MRNGASRRRADHAARRRHACRPATEINARRLAAACWQRSIAKRVNVAIKIIY